MQDVDGLFLKYIFKKLFLKSHDRLVRTNFVLRIRD